MQLRWEKYIGPERGVATTECALSMLPFAALTIGFFQLSLAAFQTATLHHVVSRSARWASTGIEIEGGTVRAELIKAHVEEIAGSLWFGVEGLAIKLCPASNPGCDSNDAAGSSQFVSITATRPSINILGVGYIPISSTVVIKNEPF